MIDNIKVKDIDNIKVSRSDVIAESKDSILIRKNNVEYGIQKKFCRNYDYQLAISVGIKPTGEYNLSKNKEKIKGYDLIGLYKEPF